MSFELNIHSPEQVIFDVVFAQHFPSSGNYCAGEFNTELLEDVFDDLGLIGQHPKFLQAAQKAASFAQHNFPVLLTGETGSGKDLFAKLVHRMSARKYKPMIVLNCAALPENLAESILFGHVRGAFTGASTPQIGKFVLADKGTLFLDELAELPSRVQAKLLRVLEDGLVDPLGSKAPTPVDVRIICSTNCSLKQRVRDGLFREDLYYRLAVGEVDLPSLSERRSDILLIAQAFMEELGTYMPEKKTLSSAAKARLEAHPWPGNVRELKSTLQRAFTLSQESIIDAQDLFFSDEEAQLPPDKIPLGPGFSLEAHLRELRESLIEKALEESEGKQAKAARMLGISPQAVHQFLKQKSSSN